MKCSECGHRNRLEDNFCMICAAPLTSTPPSGKRVALPPQDMLEGFADRPVNLPSHSRSFAWAWWATGLVAVAIVVAVYLLYFLDTYQVQAIDYFPSYDQTGSSRSNH